MQCKNIIYSGFEYDVRREIL